MALPFFVGVDGLLFMPQDAEAGHTLKRGLRTLADMVLVGEIGHKRREVIE
ncbi:MAG: hypothetical protein M3220_10995 [Chloroflexota bacterium]|nr:hypothetical protein [Chloroflexota bacterium]